MFRMSKMFRHESHEAAGHDESYIGNDFNKSSKTREKFSENQLGPMRPQKSPLDHSGTPGSSHGAELPAQPRQRAGRKHKKSKKGTRSVPLGLESQSTLPFGLVNPLGFSNLMEYISSGREDNDDLAPLPPFYEHLRSLG